MRHDDTFASLRVVNIVEDLDLVSLTQVLAWDLPLTKKVSDQVARHARDTNLGTVTLVEKVSEKAAQRNSGKGAAKTADVMLRYNFPGAGLTDDALRTLILLVLDAGAQIRRASDGLSPLGPAVRAGAEDLDGVADVGEAVLAATSAAHTSTSWSPTSMVATAAAAHQMVVMVLGAPAVDRLAGVGAQRVDHSRRRHRLQCPVDGGQADVLAAAAQLVVQLLGRAELVERFQQRRNRRSLAGGADAGARRAGHRSRRVLAGVGDRVDDDVRKVVVGKPVEDFAAGALPGDHTRRLEDLQMLADQRLWHAEGVDQFMHAALGFAQLQHDGDPHRRGQRAQQLAGGVENLPRRRRGILGESGAPAARRGRARGRRADQGSSLRRTRLRRSSPRGSAG